MENCQFAPTQDHNLPATVTMNDAQSSFGGDAEMLTSATLQTKIGNLALTFPNSQQTTPIYYKRVINHEQQTADAGFVGTPSKSKPRTGDMPRRNRGNMLRPDLCNINPDNLDDETLRNMNAIGIDFVTKKTNKLKPYESQGRKMRKLRKQYQQENLKSLRTETMSDKPTQTLVDYDGSTTEKSVILSRR